VLAIASNLSKERTDVRLSLNLDKLGLPANVSAKDAVSRAALTIENGDITINIPAQDYRLVWIEADTALNPNK
jgi:tRNA threonylcarbamoyladenosine modification (KEOPS) complex  Pcc1 subunit